MEGNLARFKDDLARLSKLSNALIDDLTAVATGKKVKTGDTQPGQIFFAGYQRWYSEAHEVIRQLLPNRIQEFELLYSGNDKRKRMDAETYAIKDWLLGIRAKEDYYGKKTFNDNGAVFMRLQTQVQILESANMRFESSLFDVKQILQADLFDCELESARELSKKGFIRAGGAIAGVVAERHLELVCKNHDVRITVKDPTIAIYNDMLKNADVYEVPEWRFIQRLGDLRNLCDHKKEREPTKSEVAELIDGVDKLTKTII